MARQGIPTAVHESNMVPGLTTKMLEQHVDRVMVGFEECRQLYRHPERVVVTGTPVRGDFFALSHDEAREKLGIPEGTPLVVSFWGSLGASQMNHQMMDFFQRLRRFIEKYVHKGNLEGAGVKFYDINLDEMKDAYKAAQEKAGTSFDAEWEAAVDAAKAAVK